MGAANRKWLFTTVLFTLQVAVQSHNSDVLMVDVYHYYSSVIKSLTVMIKVMRTIAVSVQLLILKCEIKVLLHS